MLRTEREIQLSLSLSPFFQMFLTRHLLGEDPRGLWTIIVEDSGWRRRAPSAAGRIRSVSVRIFGTEKAPGGLQENRAKGRKMTSREVRTEYHEGRMRALKAAPLDRRVMEVKRWLDEGKPLEAVRDELRRLVAKKLPAEDRKALQDVLKENIRRRKHKAV